MDWQDKARDVLKQLNIVLSDEQAAPFYDPARIKIVAGGEGSGKSFMGALYGLCRATVMAVERRFEPVLVWVVGADFEDAHKEMEYLIGPERTWLEDLGIFDRERSSIPAAKDQKIVAKTTVGITFETISGYDPLKVGRDQPDIVVGCEVSRWPVELWNRAYGRLARRYHQGSCGWFSGSFESSLGWFPEIWTVGQSGNPLDIKSFSIPSWANRAIYPGGFDDPAIQQLRLQMSEQRFMERHGGRPMPASDSVLPQFRVYLHVDSDCEYAPDYPVHLFVDPGTSVYAVLFVQIVGREVRIVDEVYVSHYTHEQVIQECTLRPAWRGVRPDGTHVMDIAGTQSHMGMQPPVEAWYRDTGLTFRTKLWKVDDQVDKLMQVLGIDMTTGRPYLRIHPRCRGIIAEMGGGPSPVPNSGRWTMKNGKPEQLRNNHSCKALAYGLLTMFGAKRPGREDDDDRAVSYLTPRPIIDSYIRRYAQAR